MSSERGKSAFGVFTEFGTSALAMKAGDNVRVFNTVTAEGRGFISYDQGTGTLTLAAGTYKIDGYSITTFGYMLTAEQQATVRSLPGYAYFYNLDDKSVVIRGSMQDPMYSFPSHVNDVITVLKTTRFYLGHQNGNDVAGVMLETYDPGFGTNHVFARLVVERLG